MYHVFMTHVITQWITYNISKKWHEIISVEGYFIPVHSRQHPHSAIMVQSAAVKLKSHTSRTVTGNQ